MRDILETVKGHCSDTITVVGGAASTADPEFLLEELPADFMIIGEGEKTFEELFTALQEGQTTFSDIPGIGYMDEDNKFIKTAPRQLIENLDELPFPDYEAFEYGTYMEKQLFETNNLLAAVKGNAPRIRAAIVTSRDCIMKCTFCFRIMGETVNEPLNNKVTFRQRSLDNVFEEINYLLDTYKINELSLMDDMFAARPSRVIEFCERIAPYKMLWHCQLRASSAREKVLPKMKESGCWQISYGFESGSPKVLKNMKKGTTIKHITNAIELGKKYKIGIQGNFIYGDPIEDLDTMEETMKFSRNFKDILLGYGLVIPYPGTVLYQDLIDKKVINDKKDFYYSPRNYNMTKLDNADYTYMLGRIGLETASRRKAVQAKILSVEKKGDLFAITAQCPSCRATNEMQITLNSLKEHDIYCKECFRKFLVGASSKKIRKLLDIHEDFLIVARRFLEYKIIWPVVFSSHSFYRLVHRVLYPIYKYLGFMHQQRGITKSRENVDGSEVSEIGEIG